MFRCCSQQDDSQLCVGTRCVSKISRQVFVLMVFFSFQGYFFIYFFNSTAILSTQLAILKVNPNDMRLQEGRPKLRRAIYTIGMFMRYFDFMDKDVYGEFSVRIFKSIPIKN